MIRTARFFLSGLCLLLSALRLSAQDRPDFYKGADCQYDFRPQVKTAPPKGYKPFYISHYGRHGSRHVWQGDLYDYLYALLQRAGAAGLLTQDGERLKADYEQLYPAVRYREGELTEQGWAQHREIARVMARDYPEVFGKGASVEAYSSFSMRAVLSMSSFCLSLGQCFPKLPIVEHQSRVLLGGVVPTFAEYPYRDTSAVNLPMPFPGTLTDFVPQVADVPALLGKVFRDVSILLPEEKDQLKAVTYLYYLQTGMGNLDPRIQIPGPFTEKELEALWLIDNYKFFYAAWGTQHRLAPVVGDIIDRAEVRICKDRPGADLRFGHDFVIRSLLVLLDVDGYGKVPGSPAEIRESFHNDRIPMASNLQFIFYRKGRSDGDILFKLLFNGREATLPLESSLAPYYRWDDFKRFYCTKEAK